MLIFQITGFLSLGSACLWQVVSRYLPAASNYFLSCVKAAGISSVLLFIYTVALPSIPSALLVLIPVMADATKLKRLTSFPALVSQ